MPDTLIAISHQLAEQLTITLKNTGKALDNVASIIQSLNQQVDRSRLLNEDEAVVYLRRDAGTLHYYRKSKELPHYKKGGSVWYMKGEVDDWLASGKVNRHTR